MSHGGIFTGPSNHTASGTETISSCLPVSCVHLMLVVIYHHRRLRRKETFRPILISCRLVLNRIARRQLANYACFVALCVSGSCMDLLAALCYRDGEKLNPKTRKVWEGEAKATHGGAWRVLTVRCDGGR